MVAINGPEVVHADEVIKDAMRIHWKNSSVGAHFIRRDSNIKSYTVSKAVDNIVAITPKIQFMVE